LAVVPAFHLVLELADREWQGGQTWRLHAFLLMVQGIILVLAILVRGSAAYVVGPILVVGLLRAWKNRHDHNDLRLVRREACVIALVGVIFVGSLLLALPRGYVRDGHLAATTEFWHRAIVSLGVNPAWPFGNLHEIYDCRNGDIPEGLTAGAL